MTHQSTSSVRSGIETDPQFGAVVPPLYLSSNFTFAGLNRPRDYDYTRTANPTRDLLGQSLAELESGAGGVVTSSGMSAITLVVQLLSPGDLLVAPHDCYGGSYRLFENLAAKGQFRLRFIDFNDVAAVDQAFAEVPRMVWVETPSNPLLRITDIEAIAARARSADALLVADNTFLSPVLQQPITLGADIVVHSTTKYLNGHSDVVGGAVVAATSELHEQLSWWANCLGLTGAPFDSFLTLRGVRTLHARMRVHEENANRLARLLADHPLVARVHYPGLPDHPGHALAQRQQKGFGGMLSFEIADLPSAVEAFLGRLRHFSLAESLGGVESLIAHPASMTHAAMDADAQRTAGISSNLLRVSVGIEDGDDLCADLAGALDAVEAGSGGSDNSALSRSAPCDSGKGTPRYAANGSDPR